MYLTVSVMASDQSLRNRVAACAAKEGVTTPENWAYTNAYTWASSPGWDEKWEYAVAHGNENPGADPTVITDGDILATVQSMLKP